MAAGRVQVTVIKIPLMANPSFSTHSCHFPLADDELCAGKMVAAASSQTRAELVDGHILLPEDAVLVPLFSFPYTESHVAPKPALRTPILPHPSLSGSNHPASPYSTVIKSQSLSLVRPQHPLSSPYGAERYGSQPVSLGNVRNPQNHLHFPYNYPYSQGDSDVGYGFSYYTV